MTSETRNEHDLLGYRDVPASAYYGIHTLRAVENFSISGIRISSYPELINALAAIKQSAALANMELGLLDQTHGKAIIAACEEIRGGALHEHFVVDVIQGGAGTSTNMNANEVVANRALEILGHVRGDYDKLHPNEHVNMSQSTNDVYPTALKIATYHSIFHLVDAMAILRRAFERKSLEFADIIKMGRTQLQDAVPMTLGQEFSTYAVMLGEDEERLSEAALLIHEINLGATAIGTGLNAHPDYAALSCRQLRAITGIQLLTGAESRSRPRRIAARSCSCPACSSGSPSSCPRSATICGCCPRGPRAGLGEINLPAVQAGSSIMPGKVNPVIPEVVNQVAFEVIGNDVTVSLAAEAGQLQLNAFEPIIAHSLFKSMTHLRGGVPDAGRALRHRHHRQPRSSARRSSTRSAWSPRSTPISVTPGHGDRHEAHATGRGVYELVLERKLLPAATLAKILQPDQLTRPHGMTVIE